MKRFALLACAVLLLWLDVRVSTEIAYPEYEPHDKFGRLTQELVMEHVVGDSFRIDVLPDLVGYVLLFVVAFGGSREKKGYRMAMTASIVAVFCELLRMLLPFAVGGVTVYATEYFLHLGGYVLDAFLLFWVVRCFAEEYDRLAVHKTSVAAVITMMLALLCGLAQNFGWFFDVKTLPTVYAILCGLVSATFLGCLYRLVSYKPIEEQTPEAE